MNTTPQIKIIKLTERLRQAEERAAQRLVPVKQSAQEKTRDTTTTIKGWIGELRLRKLQNTETALLRLKSLFGEAK